VTAAVRRPTTGDQAWAALSAELTPAKSLARVDTVTARAVTTITVVGLLLTGLGTLSAGLLSRGGLARDLAFATVITAAVAVACALTAQVLTITRHVNAANLEEVKAWYWRQFRTRAYPTQAATILLLIAALLAGATAAAALTTSQSTAPTISITQTVGSPAVGNGITQVTVTAKVTFHGLASGQQASLNISAPGRMLARAAATPAPGGTTVIALAAGHLTAGQPITITAQAPGQSCQAVLIPGRGRPVLTCRSH
jgi:hypothetical protein